MNQLSRARVIDAEVVREASGTALTGRDAISNEWVKAAAEALQRLFRVIAQIDGHKAEAERIHAALAAYGVPNLPALPWGKPATRRQRASNFVVACDRCGRRASARAFDREQGGKRVCRDQTLCLGRQVAQKEAGVGE